MTNQPKVLVANLEQYREISVSPWVPSLNGHRVSAPGEAFFLNNPTFSDVIIEVDPLEDSTEPAVRFFAHKCLLVRRSQRMRKLLSATSSSNQPQVVQFPSGELRARRATVLTIYLQVPKHGMLNCSFGFCTVEIFLD